MDQREAVKSLYKSQTWYKKVDNMSDDQVTAIYLRAKRNKKL